MDPLSITASAIGITSAAIASINALKTLINDIKDAPDELKRIQTSLRDIEPSISALKDISVPDQASKDVALAELKKTGIAEVVESCATACEEFKGRLEKWTKHSNANKLSLRDRFTVGVWEKDAIDRYTRQIEACKETVTFAVSTTSLLLLKRMSQASTATRDDSARLQTQMQVLETKLQENLDFAKDQKALVLARRQDLQQQLKDDDGDKETQLQVAIAENTKAKDVLEEQQVSYGVMFVQVQSGRTGLKIGDVMTSENSRALVGLPESVIGRIDAQIGNVTTSGESTSVVGVFPKSFKMDDLKNLPRPPAQ